MRTQMSSLLRKKFVSSKCKTLLQLASQRFKVLTTKQTLTVKKVRGDVAKLLEKNHDSDTNLQVEAVFREEKILVLYELLDQFCQHLVDGLESIKSQKECPVDLREAVASLIFAAPNCAQVEELKQVSKQFKAKYGRDFCKAAKELRPDSGVNQQVIQSFSPLPFSYEGKLKLLKEIALENNIEWKHEMTIPDSSKGATCLISGPNYFASAAEISQVDTHPIIDEQNVKSMHVNELKGQGNAILQNAIGSHTMSAANPLGLPLHAAHQLAKNIGAMGSSVVADRVLHTPVLDPYALAKAEGKMDYRAISNYMKRAQSMELRQESTGGTSYGRAATQLVERKQHQNVVLDTSHSEDSVQKSQGMMTNRRHDSMSAYMMNEEEELLDLQKAAEYAFASASHAAEAARAAVTLVRKESLERSRSRQAKDENYRKTRMDSKHNRISCEDKTGIVFNQHNGVAADQISEKNSSHSRDASEDSLKYVVFEQKSGSQKHAPISLQAEEHGKISESCTIPEVWNEPTFYNPDRTIFDIDYEEAHQDKHVQNDLPVPQFDDYGSEEDEYVRESLLASQPEDHINEEVNKEEVPFYRRGRAALATEDHANVITRAPFSKASKWMPTVNSSTEEEVEELSTNMPSKEYNSGVYSGLSVEPLGVSNDKERAIITGISSAQSDKEEGLQNLSSDDNEKLERLPVQSSEALFRNQISTKSTGGNSITSPDAYKESLVKSTTPQKLKWAASIPEELDLDPSCFKPIPQGSMKHSSPNENKYPLSQVSQKLNLSPGASVDSKFMSERSFDLHKREDVSLDSSKPSSKIENLTKMMYATQVSQPSIPRSFGGVSKRSVRSARSRQSQDACSMSSGIEDMVIP